MTRVAIYKEGSGVYVGSNESSNSLGSALWSKTANVIGNNVACTWKDDNKAMQFIKSLKNHESMNNCSFIKVEPDLQTYISKEKLLSLGLWQGTHKTEV